MSHSENKPKTTQTSSTAVTNINFQDTEGVNVAGDGNYIVATDHGAVQGAGNVAVEALRTSEESQRGARELISRAVDDAFTFGADAFYYGSEIVDRAGQRVQDTADSALDFGRDSLNESFGYGRDVLNEAGGLIRGVFQDAIDTVGNVLGEGQAQVGDSLAAINAIAREQSKSDAERVQSIAQNALIAGAVMVGLVVLAQVWKS